MTVPIAALAARTCAAVDSAARTIMSSIFSNPSPPAAGIANSLLLSVAPIRFASHERTTTHLYLVSAYEMHHLPGADFALIRKPPEHNRGLAAARMAIDADVSSFKVTANHG